MWDQIYNLAEKLGFPAVVVIFVGWGLWKIVVWVGEKLVLPISQSHIELVKSTEQTQKTNTDTLSKVTDILRVNLDLTQRMSSQNSDIVNGVQAANAKLDKMVPKP